MKEHLINYIYYILNFIFVILYILSFLGQEDKDYTDMLNQCYKIFIALVLIYFFNPWSKEKLNDFNKKIAFSAGLVLIFTSSISVLIKQTPIIRKIPYLNKIITATKLFR
tara:strand:+ start:584 stop:913 length:330 start_codon:yes stop_codon:yes gene_type:complete